MDGADQVAPRCPVTPACDDAMLIAESVRMPERFGVLFDRHAPAIHRYPRHGRSHARPVIAALVFDVLGAGNRPCHGG